jgi:hypothetical protein
VTDDLALAAMLLELQRRGDDAHDAEALARLRRLVMDDEIAPLDIRDTFIDENRVRRAVGIAIATCRIQPSPGQLLDARRSDVVQLATEQLRREVVRLLNQVTEL